MSLDTKHIKTTSTKHKYSKIAGTLLLIGGVQWFLAVMLAEGLHPGYNSAVHYVSSLGIGVTSPIFNSSVFMLGAAVVGGAGAVIACFLGCITA